MRRLDDDWLMTRNAFTCAVKVLHQPSGVFVQMTAELWDYDGFTEHVLDCIAIAMTDAARWAEGHVELVFCRQDDEWSVEVKEVGP